MQVSDIMTTDVASLSPYDSCIEAARLMAACDCGFIPVADGDRLVGVITDRDIAIRLVAEGRDPATEVRNVMTHRLLYCYDDENIEEAADNMAEMQVRRLPVVNRSKRLVGVIALGDIAGFNESCSGMALRGISAPPATLTAS